MGESRVTGDERCPKDLGEHDEGRVMRGQVVSQLPHPVGEQDMWVADDGEVGQVRPGVGGPIVTDHP